MRIPFFLLLAAFSLNAFAADADLECLKGMAKVAHEQVMRETAERAGLKYQMPEGKGIRRAFAGDDTYTYWGPDGKQIVDPEEIKRIEKIRVPPGWKDERVWISPAPDGHIQAKAGDKQYKYHAKWNTTRSKDKFDRSFRFGSAMPKLRSAVEADLKREGLPREKIQAALVRALELSRARVGKSVYARDNEHFGLTSLLKEHLISINGPDIHFKFTGKSSVPHEFSVRDPELAVILGELNRLPGPGLFKYVDKKGNIFSLSTTAVNDYIRKATGQKFTAKDFRTWEGTVLAAKSLMEAGLAENLAQAKKNISQAIEAAAAGLRNEPQESRKSYVHPKIREAYLDGKLFQEAVARARAPEAVPSGLSTEERLVLELIGP